MSAGAYAELARLGTATVYEGGGRRGLIDAPLHQVVPGSRVAGPARIARCAQDDNLMVHAAILVDASVRDLEELVELGLPIWARYVRIRGAVKETPGELDVPVEVGGTTIRPGDIVVLDADGAAVVEQERVAVVLEGARRREENERVKRAKLQEGALSYDLDGLRAIVEGAP